MPRWSLLLFVIAFVALATVVLADRDDPPAAAPTPAPTPTPTWGAEEIGLVGSRRYVDRLDAAERRRIAAYVNLDMVGTPGAEHEVYDGAPRIEAALRRGLPRGTAR